MAWYSAGVRLAGKLMTSCSRNNCTHPSQPAPSLTRLRLLLTRGHPSSTCSALCLNPSYFSSPHVVCPPRFAATAPQGESSSSMSPGNTQHIPPLPAHIRKATSELQFLHPLRPPLSVYVLCVRCLHTHTLRPSPHCPPGAHPVHYNRDAPYTPHMIPE